MKSKPKMPWSFYSTLASFGVFFASANLYILTKWLDHPFSSDLWLIGVVIGLVWLMFSIHMVRKQQQELIWKKQLQGTKKCSSAAGEYCRRYSALGITEVIALIEPTS